MAEKIRFATWANSLGGEHESYRREYKSLYLILSEKHLLDIPVCVGVGHVIGGHQGHEEQMAICLLRALREELAPLPSHMRTMMNLRGLEKTGPEPALACGWEQRGDGAAAGPVMWSKSWEVK